MPHVPLCGRQFWQPYTLLKSGEAQDFASRLVKYRLCRHANRETRPTPSPTSDTWDDYAIACLQGRHILTLSAKPVV